MLVLTRKVGESVVAGEQIRITVLEIKGDQIRLGIDAPRSIAIHRGEIYESIQRANQEAVKLMPDLSKLGEILPGKKE